MVESMFFLNSPKKAVSSGMTRESMRLFEFSNFTTKLIESTFQGKSGPPPPMTESWPEEDSDRERSIIGIKKICLHISGATGRKHLPFLGVNMNKKYPMS
jgi:hypothetical protein